MKIESSQVALFSEHSKKHEVIEEEKLVQWSRPEDDPRGERDSLHLSKKFQKLKETEAMDETPLSPKLMAIIRALEALTGKKIDISTYKQSEPLVLDVPLDRSSDIQLEGWGVDYSYSKTEIKEENLHFMASGNVKSADGIEMDFKLAFEMNSKSVYKESVSLKGGDALVDPLVINFDNNIVKISDMKHSFDLDLDGKKDTFNFVASGSGFLALDKNEDGTINDGNELFGPSLGNGFDELKKYDEDQNAWIDENDSIFEKLQVWTKEENGQSELYSLKDKGIGALYLERATSVFGLEDGSQLKESSIYLNENGKAGTIQEIDLKI